MDILRDQKDIEKRSGALVARGTPLEAAEQAALFRWLRRNKVRAFAVPNGGLRPGRAGFTLKAQGVTKGIPDLLIIDSPPNRPEFVGIALELKRSRGKLSDIRPEQMEWLTLFEERGWLSAVAFGADAAVDWLVSLGFGDD
tara:strand:- start:563 stop:985 length:423 start_codon:yes stop_codon:yes gene_type:complete